MVVCVFTVYSLQIRPKNRVFLERCDVQCENKSNCAEKQGVVGCINRMWSQGGVVGHTRKRSHNFHPRSWLFASLEKPNLIIILTTVTFVLCVRMRRAHIPHKQDNERMSSGYVGRACVVHMRWESRRWEHKTLLEIRTRSRQSYAMRWQLSPLTQPHSSHLVKYN